MKRWISLAVFGTMLVPAVHAQYSVRYFLSLTGLSNPGNSDSAAVTPAGTVDPVIVSTSTATTRLYIWADIGISPVPTDLTGFELQFQATGNVTIPTTNFWQNTFTIPSMRRWDASGFPGMQAWGPSTFVTPGITRAGSEVGLSTGPLGLFDDQLTSGKSLVGFIEVQGTNGTIDILNVETYFLGGTGPTNTVFLGWADSSGSPAREDRGAYSSPTPEATFVPEASGLALLAVAGLFARRRG